MSLNRSLRRLAREAVVVPSVPLERPILFSGPMVRAIIEDRKTRTRRVVTDQNSVGNFKASELDLSTAWVDGSDGSGDYPAHQYLHASLSAATAKRLDYGPDGDGIVERLYPRWQPDERLWVRETHWVDTDGSVLYHADGPPYCNASKWRPSIHTKRQHSRVTLHITGVRVERLQDITRAEADAEGLTPGWDWRGAWRTLWDGLNAERGYSWTANPWVWVIGFKRCSQMSDLPHDLGRSPE